jgi:hypothetical protein
MGMKGYVQVDNRNVDPKEEQPPPIPLEPVSTLHPEGTPELVPTGLVLLSAVS